MHINTAKIPILFSTSNFCIILFAILSLHVSFLNSSSLFSDAVVILFESSAPWGTSLLILSFSISVDVSFGFKKFLKPEIKFLKALESLFSED